MVTYPPRIIAIPYAGGDKYVYRPFLSCLPDTVNFHTVELPGRGARKAEPFAATIDEMVVSLMRQIDPDWLRQPYAIYGHSMGSVVGFELIKYLMLHDFRPPMFAFFTGAGSPRSALRAPLAHLQGLEFWNALNRYNGVHPTILQNEDIRNYFEPVMRSDFEALEQYRRNAHKGIFTLPFPIYVRTGMDEDILTQDLADWQNFTSKQLNIHQYSGDHFSYIKKPMELCDDLINAMRPWI